MPEALKIRCGNCGATLKLKDASAAGKTVRCPRCQKAFVVELPRVPTATADSINADPDDEFSAALQSLPAPDASSDREGSREQVVLHGGPPPEAASPASDTPKEKRSRKRKKLDPEKLQRQIYLGWIVGGGIGGAIGAAIWAVVGRSTGYEFGWLAWGVGAFTGIGRHIGGPSYGDSRSGGIAEAIALFSIVLGRLLASHALTENPLDALDVALGFFFDPLGFLWGALAGFTAYRIGSGSEFD